MLQSFQLSLNAMFPLAVLMLLGRLLRKKGLLHGETIENVNRIVFYLCLPCLLFNNIMDSDFASTPMGFVSIYTAAGVVAMFLLSWVVAVKIEPDFSRRGVLTQSMMRSNIALYGVPVTIAIFGEGHTGPISVLLVVVIPIVNIACLFILERYRGGATSPLQMLKKIASNPLIHGVLLGLIVKNLGISLPTPVSSTVRSLGAIATPMSFLIMGARFTLTGARSNRRLLLIIGAMRLVVWPLVFVGLAILLGIRNEALLALLIVFAAPASVSSYTMASELSKHGDLACEVVVTTTVASVFTMFLWLFVLSLSGLFGV